jgi:hypothetical protein
MIFNGLIWQTCFLESQSHYGSIKIDICEKPFDDDLWSQSHYGSIKIELTEDDLKNSEIKSQSHYGSIKM